MGNSLSLEGVHCTVYIHRNLAPELQPLKIWERHVVQVSRSAPALLSHALI